MNSKIKALADQAGIRPEIVVKGTSTYLRDIPELEKFAELIIQDCIDIIHKQERIPSTHFYAKGAYTHEFAIKAHFGIE